MRLSALSSLAWLALILAGCSSYTLGPTNGDAAGEKSVQVIPFANQTVEPYLTDAVTTEIRKRLQQDGTYRLDTQNNGDIILTGVITGYHRTGFTPQPGNVYAIQDVQVIMTAQVTARSRTSGKVIVQSTVSSQVPVQVGNDLVSAERQMLPILSQKLAQNVVALLADGGW